MNYNLEAQLKLTINIDCTPEEARTFFGMPDVTSVNELIVKNLEQRVQENMDTLTDPQKHFDQMMQMSGTGMENMRSMFAQMMSTAAKSE